MGLEVVLYSTVPQVNGRESGGWDPYFLLTLFGKRHCVLCVCVCVCVCVCGIVLVVAAIVVVFSEVLGLFRWLNDLY